MATTNKKLVALHCSVRKEQRLVFRYKDGRWEIFESLRPWDIREALRNGMEKIEEAIPGTIAKAAAIDDKNWQSNKRRTRRYIAESPDLLYIAGSRGQIKVFANISGNFDLTLIRIHKLLGIAARDWADKGS